jgi:hypothetical protein
LAPCCLFSANAATIYRCAHCNPEKLGRFVPRYSGCNRFDPRKCARQQHRISACRYPGKEKQCRKNLLIPKRFVNPFDSNHRASGNPRKGAENGIVKSKRHEDP